MLPGMGVLVSAPCPGCGRPFCVYARKGLDPARRRVFWWYVCSACRAAGEAVPERS